MEIIHVTEKNTKMKPLKCNFQNIVGKVEDNQIKKCLFGTPQVEDLENLLKEQMDADWARIRCRFGINLEDIENVENTPTRKRKFRENCRKSATFKRRCLFQPYNSNNKKITDFYQVRKNALQQPDNKKDDADENS